MRKITYLFFVLLVSCKAHHPESFNDGYNKEHLATLDSPATKKTKSHLQFKEEPESLKMPYSRYGNPDTYRVNGESFHVMRSANGYKKQGIASWYGRDFHKKRTSSGEPYDMFTLTAAHKTLPLPSYVKVTNLNNGREVIVRLNDRGPFVGDRIIDLSYAAAEKLDMLNNGTAPVEVESMLSDVTIASYYLQAGAFSSERRAIDFQNKLIGMTSTDFYIEQLDERYLVKAGPFADQKTTAKLLAMLKDKGVEGSFTMLN